MKALQSMMASTVAEALATQRDTEDEEQCKRGGVLQQNAGEYIRFISRSLNTSIMASIRGQGYTITADTYEVAAKSHGKLV